MSEMKKYTDEQVLDAAPEAVFGTVHGTAFGAVFPELGRAKRYPGPRGYECADKCIVSYIKISRITTLISEWQDRLQGVENEGARMELEAAIGDLECAISVVVED